MVFNKEECLNPFENFPDLFFDVFAKQHICPTVEVWDEKLKQNVEYYTDELCINGCCEYCYGHRYNEWFAEKPTKEEVKELVLKQQLKCDLAQKHQKEKLRNAKLDVQDQAQIITLCINKEYKQIPDLFRDIIDKIRAADYVFLYDCYAVCEVYGKDDNWNPHIHIVTKKVKRNGQIAQVLRRKFQNDKFQVYRVDVKPLPYKVGVDYLNAGKIAAKLEATEKDKEYREANNLDNIYFIK